MALADDDDDEEDWEFDTVSNEESASAEEDCSRTREASESPEGRLVDGLTRSPFSQ